jgi:hypothetical protein
MPETALNFSDLKKSLVADAQKRLKLRLVKGEVRDIQRQRSGDTENSMISPRTRGGVQGYFREENKRTVAGDYRKAASEVYRQKQTEDRVCYPES